MTIQYRSDPRFAGRKGSASSFPVELFSPCQAAAGLALAQISRSELAERAEITLDDLDAFLTQPEESEGHKLPTVRLLVSRAFKDIGLIALPSRGSGLGVRWKSGFEEFQWRLNRRDLGDTDQAQ